MNFWSTIQFSFRQLWKRPGFTVTVLATLGLCIGANTAIYSVIDAVLVQPLPYPQADRLGSLARHTRSPRGEDTEFGMDGQMWEAVHRGATKIDTAAQGNTSGVNLAAGSRIQYVQQRRVSAGYFHVLGIQLLQGREFDPSEDAAGGPTVTVLSYTLWEQSFQKDAGVLGRRIDLKGEPYTVIGVLPKSFVNNDKIDVWTPLHPSTTGEGSGANYTILTRLKPGVSWNEASSEVRVLEQSLLNDQLVRYRAPRGVAVDMRLVSLHRALSDTVRASILPKWGAVGLILFIGCINVAGLLLAQSASRRREIATRMALGASRARVISQLLTESLVLALGGGVLGIGVASLALDGLQKAGMDGFNLWRPVRLDSRVLLMTMAVSLATSLLFGLIPALQTSGLDIRSVLLEGGRTTPGRGQQKIRQVLVIGQIALGLMLLASAGLLIRTLAYLERVNPGFDPHHVLAAQLSLDDARYRTGSSINGLYTKSLQRIRALPGVESAAVGLSLPYQRPLNDGFQILDGGARNAESFITDMVMITPGYFETLRMPFGGGRTFVERDDAGSQRVAIVNHAFVRRYLRAQSPLGVHLGLSGAPTEIVGLVADTPQQSGAGSFGPLSATPTIYVPVAQVADPGMTYTWFSPNWVVRTNGNQRDLIAAMQKAMESVDPRLPFSAFQSMEELQGSSVARQRYEAVLFSIFAALALLLTSVGIYGLVAHSVSHRAKEIGIRMALGATVRDAIASIVAPTFKLAVVGTTIGLVLTWFASALLQDLIWGVQTHDALNLMSVAAVMLSVAMAASLLPALQLIRLNPLDTLRRE